jgi:hypothetical protein
MNSLRALVVMAGMLALSPARLSAQAGRVSCKDGTLPKVGHFSCWGHGGVVAGAPKPAAKGDVKQAGKPTAKPKTASKHGKPTGKKAHATAAKSGKAAHAKKAPKSGTK